MHCFLIKCINWIFFHFNLAFPVFCNKVYVFEISMKKKECVPYCLVFFHSYPLSLPLSSYFTTTFMKSSPWRQRAWFWLRPTTWGTTLGFLNRTTVSPSLPLTLPPPHTQSAAHKCYIKLLCIYVFLCQQRWKELSDWELNMYLYRGKKCPVNAGLDLYRCKWGMF